MKLEIFVLFLLVIHSVHSTKTGTAKNEFIATKEWKVIDEGQSIPSGLHVRINLQTGKKEAKLSNVAEDDEPNVDERRNSAIMLSSNAHDDDTANVEDPKKPKPRFFILPSVCIPYSRLKDALKHIPDEGTEYSEEKLKEITKKFKSHETIKREFEEMNMHIRSDFEIMSKLFERYADLIADTGNDLNGWRTLFEDFEYLLHQIDNTNDFVTADGLEKIIVPNLIGNRTVIVPELRHRSVKLLGILMQNNPKGQIAALERNVGFILLQMLSSQSTGGGSTNNISSTNDLSSVITFAIGGLLRKFPLAQDELLNSHGLKILIEDLLGGGPVVDFRVKMKCLLLITDLIREHDEAINDVDDFDRAKQYHAIDFKNRLTGTELCVNVVELLKVHRQDYLESLYVTDDLLNVLIECRDICQQRWSESTIFRQTLLAMRSQFDQQKNDGTNFDETELNGVADKLEILSFNRTVVNDEL